MIEKCQVKILSNKVICDSKIEDNNNNNKDMKKKYENIKNKKKYDHLIDIGERLRIDLLQTDCPHSCK